MEDIADPGALLVRNTDTTRAVGRRGSVDGTAVGVCSVVVGSKHSPNVAGTAHCTHVGEGCFRGLRSFFSLAVSFFLFVLLVRPFFFFFFRSLNLQNKHEKQRDVNHRIRA